MKKKVKLFLILLVILVIGVAWSLSRKPKEAMAPVSEIASQSAPEASPVENPNLTKTLAEFQAPLDRAKERVAKKPFAIYIDTKTSPVQPERFRGYHTGTDFEIFPEELTQDVSVKAICSGKLQLKEIASGYGGVAIQECKIDGQSMTVIYGHLKLSSLTQKVGDVISVGDTLGILGKGESSETDGERKHLHLGIHKGSSPNIRGYVSSKSDLSDWIDPYLLVCGK